MIWDRIVGCYENSRVGIELWFYSPPLPEFGAVQKFSLPYPQPQPHYDKGPFRITRITSTLEFESRSVLRPLPQPKSPQCTLCLRPILSHFFSASEPVKWWSHVLLRCTALEQSLQLDASSHQSLCALWMRPLSYILHRTHSHIISPQVRTKWQRKESEMSVESLTFFTREVKRRFTIPWSTGPTKAYHIVQSKRNVVRKRAKFKRVAKGTTVWASWSG